jgi:actin-related protein 5
VSVPDEELSEADRKEKKKQRLLKASYDARMRAKAAKAEEAAHQVLRNCWMKLVA